MTQRQKAFVVALSVAGLFRHGQAQAQILTTDGLLCGKQTIPLEISHGTGVSAIVAREQVLSRLFSARRAAQVACGAHGPAVAALPGCNAIDQWLKDLEAFKDTDTPPLALKTAVAADLLAESNRILAHEACSRGANGKNPSFDATCVALVREEEAASHFTPLVPPAARVDTVQTLLGTRAPTNVPNLQLLQTVVSDPADPRTGAMAAFVKERDQCLAGQTCNQEVARAVNAIDSIIALRAFYNSDNNAVQIVTPAISRRVDEVTTGLVPPSPIEVVVPGEDAGATYLRTLFNEAKSGRRQCENADFYVSPSGTLVHQGDRDATLCVDTSLYSLDRPFEVEFSEYPQRTRAASMPTRTRVVTAWAGKMMKLNEPFSGSIVRVIVRGYPSGASLRAFALKGANSFDSSFSVNGLFAAQHKAQVEDDTRKSSAATVAALKALAETLSKDTNVAAAVKGASDPLAAAAKSPTDATVQAARSAIANIETAVAATLLKFATDNPLGDALAASTAVALSQPLVPPVPASVASTADGVSSLQALQVKFSALAGLLVAKATELSATSGDAATQAQLERLCRISTELIPVVDEDILLNETAIKNAYILDYDFDNGFQRSTAGNLMSTDQIFVRVKHVPPGSAVAFSLGNNSLVEHSVSLIGMPTKAPAQTPENYSGSSQASTEGDPDRPFIQARSTQIMALGRLDGATRYDISLCEQRGQNATPCSNESAITPAKQPAADAGAKPAADSGAKAAADAGAKQPADAGSQKAIDAGATRVISRNALVVHQNRYLGVRAGFGGMIVGGAVRTISTSPGMGNYNYVRERGSTSGFGLPLLLSVYPGGRDAVDGPPPHSFAFVAGLDAIKVFTDNPTLYGGFSLDFSGFGLTPAFVYQRLESVNAAAGTYLSSTSAGTKQTEWHPGVFIGLTTDLDIFQVVFKNFGAKGLPTIGNEPNGGGS